MKQEGGEGHILPALFSVSIAVIVQGSYGPFLCPSCCCSSDSHCRPCCLPTWRWIKSWQCLLTVAGILFSFSIAGDYWSPSSLGSEQFHPLSCIFQKPFWSFYSDHCRMPLVWSYIDWVMYKHTFQHLWIHHSILSFISSCHFPSLLCSLYVLLYLVSTCLTHALNNSCLILCFFSYPANYFQFIDFPHED